MDTHTFNFSVTPGTAPEYEVALPPFRASLRGTILTLKADAHTADEQRLREQACQVAHNLARSLAYELAERFEVKYQGRHVLRDTGQQSVSVSLTFVVQPALVSTTEEGEASERRERERQAARDRIVDLTTRAAGDANLRDMLEHWYKYAGDSEGRLHPLYDVLQVVERLYGTRKKAALALNISDADLSDLGRITNDPTVLNGRHPGRTQGPHRIATESEVKTCERVARTMIENQASKLVI